MSKSSLMRRFREAPVKPSSAASVVPSHASGQAAFTVGVGRVAVAAAALGLLAGCTNGTYDCEGTDLVIDGSRIEYAGADRYEVCQTNGNIMVIGFRDQCGTTSRNYMSFDKMQRKLARGTENWDCKKK